jgi:hypothetical protein
MATVNPPIQKLPDTLFDSDPELYKYLEERQFWEYQVWKRSGGGEDFFTEVKSRLDAIELRLDLVEARVTYLEGDFEVTAVDFTTIGNMTVVVTADVTISLTLLPNDKDVVRIKQTDTALTIDGNGRNIEGESSLSVRRGNSTLKTGLDFIYSSELDEWFII